MKIHYSVCEIGYDANDCVTDYERYFGDFDERVDAQDKFDEAVREALDNLDKFFLDNEQEVAYWKIQLEKCKETENGTECIDVLDEYDICNPDNRIEVWKQYIIYLTEWAKDHRDAEYYGMSPADFDEWYDNEFCEVDDDRSEMPWDYSKHFD